MCRELRSASSDLDEAFDHQALRAVDGRIAIRRSPGRPTNQPRPYPRLDQDRRPGHLDAGVTAAPRVDNRNVKQERAAQVRSWGRRPELAHRRMVSRETPSRRAVSPACSQSFGTRQIISHDGQKWLVSMATMAAKDCQSGGSIGFRRPSIRSITRSTDSLAMRAASGTPWRSRSRASSSTQTERGRTITRGGSLIPQPSAPRARARGWPSAPAPPRPPPPGRSSAVRRVRPS